MNKNITIGICCVGSGVGQAVINSIKLSNFKCKTIGLGANPFAFGAYDCDDYDSTPYIYEANYIDVLIEKSIKHRIDILIPGLDDEALIMAKNQTRFAQAGIQTLVSSQELIGLCRDKEKCSVEFNKISDIFVKSFNIDNIHEMLESSSIDFPLIAKPHDGYASKNLQVILNVDDIRNIPSNHIIQEIAYPKSGDSSYNIYHQELKKYNILQISEISIQLVFDKNKNLIGKMATINKLKNGTPIEILPLNSSEIWNEMDKIIPFLKELGHIGPINFQGRMTDKGLKLFEVNPRFTGITGLRAMMGFNEVEASLKSWFNLKSGIDLFNVEFKSVGLRQMAERVVPIESHFQIYDFYEKNIFPINLNKKILLITGASGYLGQNLIPKIQSDGNFKLWLLGRNKEKLNALFPDNIDAYFDFDDWESGNINIGQIDTLVHLAFARPHRGYDEIANSLAFSKDLFIKCAKHQIARIINMSSQSVYGLSTVPPWTEETPVMPETAYAQAKYASELFLESMKEFHPQLKATSIRLGSLVGGANGLIEIDLLSVLVKKALSNENFIIKDGDQKTQRLDIRDAVEGLCHLLKLSHLSLHKIYNFSSARTFRLIEVAEQVRDIVSLKTKQKQIHIQIDKSLKIKQHIEMDSQYFYKLIDWEPKKSMNDIIESLIDYFGNKINSE